MRLIDADALLIENLGYCLGVSEGNIDRAPTIPLPDFKDGYKQAIIDGKTNFSRPTGEWLIVGEEQGALGVIYKIRKCSRCGWEHSLVIPDDYCPNCGLAMKGEKNEH